MIQATGTPPRRVPVFGQVLTLRPEDWRYHDGARSLTVQVAGVRDDLSRCYDGEWVWIEGYEVERPGEYPPGHRMQVLVRVDAIGDPEPAPEPADASWAGSAPQPGGNPWAGSAPQPGGNPWAGSVPQPGGDPCGGRR